jgi:hypothetical protein
MIYHDFSKPDFFNSENHDDHHHGNLPQGRSILLQEQLAEVLSLTVYEEFPEKLSNEKREKLQVVEKPSEDGTTTYEVTGYNPKVLEGEK